MKTSCVCREFADLGSGERSADVLITLYIHIYSAYSVGERDKWWTEVRSGQEAIGRLSGAHRQPLFFIQDYIGVVLHCTWEGEIEKGCNARVNRTLLVLCIWWKVWCV